jgi:hypothetical protein
LGAIDGGRHSRPRLAASGRRSLRPA